MVREADGRGTCSAIGREGDSNDVVRSGLISWAFGLDASRTRHLPAILVTGKVNSAECSGFRQVLEKPLEDGALLDGIRGALSTTA
jgi:hypothetical protein